MSGIKFNASGLFKGLEEWDNKIVAATNLYANIAATKMINDAKLKKNARWEDRTGHSRGTMDHEITRVKGKTIITLRGNTPHFKYLEFAHEKNGLY